MTLSPDTVYAAIELSNTMRLVCARLPSATCAASAQAQPTGPPPATTTSNDKLLTRSALRWCDFDWYKYKFRTRP